ncbi:MAG: decarboxylating 6-phosphogluconate dehydrogenase [Armatimonadetes bacterium]|nr:decarboxylating 6-phosphogluconate dehydrogenase [Armatimonadota bacterium]
MEMGLIGLGRMGMNMGTRLSQRGHRIVAWNRTRAKLDEAMELGMVIPEGQDADRDYVIEDMVKSMQAPRVVWVMVPAGQPTDDMLDAAAAHMSPGDVLIDGGNSYFKDTQRRSHKYSGQGLHFMDAGTSGGIWGLKVGYCLMVGGPDEGFRIIEPLIRDLAPEPSERYPEGGYKHVGPSGAGHFVKMVHNGIEYGLMQAYAEGFEILRAADKTYNYDFDLHGITRLWNQGSVVRSWLLELAEDAMEHDQNLSGIQDYVEDSGEGRWTVLTSIEEDVPAPIITLSLQARFRSRQAESYGAKVLAALRKEFGGHAVKVAESTESGKSPIENPKAPGTQPSPSVAKTDKPIEG